MRSVELVRSDGVCRARRREGACGVGGVWMVYNVGGGGGLCLEGFFDGVVRGEAWRRIVQMDGVE